MKHLFYRLPGVALLLLALAGVVLGDNLFLKFFATAVLIILAFFTVYHLVLLVRVRRRPPEVTYVGNGNLYPLVTSTVELDGVGLPFQFLGVFTRLSFALYEKGERVASRVVVVDFVSTGKIRFEVEFERHGSFILKDFCFIVGDIFGLTASRVSVNYEHSISILPYFIEEVKIPFFFERGGEEVLQTIAKEDSTDFFENRKYYPGDDPRRINWKLFAHSEELHIREVEQIPPKTGQLSLLFAPYSTEVEEYEYISSLFYTTVYYLLKYGLKLKIIWPGSDRVLTLEKTESEGLKAVLDDSYRPFNNDELLKGVERPVYFTSMLEYSRLLKGGKVAKGSFCALSYHNKELTVRDILRSLIFIDGSDSMLKELLNKREGLGDFRRKERRLAELKGLSAQKNIDLKVYYTDEK